MKISFASIVIAGSLLVSCSSSADKVEAAEENVVESNQELTAEKEAYKKEMEAYRKISDEKIASNEKKHSSVQIENQRSKSYC